MDNLIQINQGGQLRSFAYDARGRLVTQTLPESGETKYTYTDFDSIHTSTDARGVVTTYSYGAMNLLTGVSYNTSSASGVALTPSVSITYNTTSPGKGQTETVTDGSGSERYTFGDFGRLKSSTRIIDGINYQKQYKYNNIGQMTKMTYPSGKQVKVSLDTRGRLSSVSNSQ